MWSNTDGKNIQKTISRINKLNLSETAENILMIHCFLILTPQKFKKKNFWKLKLIG